MVQKGVAIFFSFFFSDMMTGHKRMVILLLGIILSFVTCGGHSVSGSKLTRTKMSKRNVVKSIRSGDGDIIDCIDIYKQPAFNHPALRNHTIQMVPTYVPKMEKMTKKTKFLGTEKVDSTITTTLQVWQRNGSCPPGTIPVRRIQNKNLSKANGVHTYQRKMPSHSKNHVMKLNNTQNYLTNHSQAILLTEGFSYSGAKADIKVWNPYVEREDEYSTSYVNLQNGNYFDFDAVESGWAVNPTVYMDNQTRFFVYWTADASKTTGCFDLTCPGFVQVSHEIALGGAIYPISKANGLPFQITVYIYKDPKTNNWWVQYGEKIDIGYWPGELFRGLKYHAMIVKWGGEVYSSWVNNDHPHTATQMGNGNFPSIMFENSGTIKRMRVEENSQELKIPEWTDTDSDEYRCYDVLYYGDYVDDPIFFYGGPGRNPVCP